MDIGTSLPHYGRAMDPQGMREFAVAAESLGFASLWVSDDVILPQGHPTPYATNMLESLTTLGFLAGVTARMRIGVSVAVLPYRHPVITAKAIASADVLSGGRVIFGVGVGASQPAEFEALNVRLRGRGSVSDEYLRAIRQMWTDPDADFAGEWVNLRGMHFSPQPLQRPHPPVWVGGASPRAIRRAVELGEGWHPVYLAPDQMAAAIAHMRELSQQHGRPDVPTASVRLPVYFDVDPRSRGAELVMAGDDAQIAEKAIAYREAGVEHLVLDVPDVPFAEAMAQLRRLGERVLPRVAG